MDKAAGKAGKLPEVGDWIAGRFRVVSEIGRGGFSVVYKAHQESIGRDVAIKFLSPHLAGQATGIERFRREALHISQLRHPNTIRLYDYGQTAEGQFFIVMEYVEGRALSSVLAHEGGLGGGRAARLMEQICLGLGEAHALGIVHRDLKPENILICDLYGETDVVKVLDFGLSRSNVLWEGEGMGLTGKGRAFGTPMYMAPEQIQGEEVTPASDVYALGLLLFEMITGRRPVEERHRQAVLKAQLLEDVPKLEGALREHALGAVIRAATAKEAQRRYLDAARMLEALRAVGGSAEELGPDPSARRSEGLAPPELGSAAGRVGEGRSGEAWTPLEVVPPQQEAGSSSKGGKRVARRGAPPFDPQVFARPRELEQLQRWARQWSQGDPGRSAARVALCFGVAGAGKSRLLRRWRAWLEEGLGLAVGAGFCRELSGHPLEAARAVLLELLRAQGASLGDVLERALEAGGASQALAEAAGFLGLGGEAERASAQGSHRLVVGLSRLLLALARARPQVVVLDDTDQASAALCAWTREAVMQARAEGLPLGFLLAGRKDRLDQNPELSVLLERGRAELGREVLDVPMGPLSRMECEGFVERVMPSSAELRGAIYEASQGNPLFVVQALRLLHAQERLTHEGGRWGLKGELGVSPRLSELLMARIDQVVARHPQQPGLRVLMQWLALLGQRTPVGMLRAAMRVAPGSSAEQRLEQELGVLVSEGLVAVEQAEERVVVFDHLLVREALLQQAEGLRAAPRLHQTAAEVKAAYYRGRGLQAPLTEIARHWKAAGELERYRAVLWEAAQAMRDRQERRRARDLYREYLRALAPSAGGAERLAVWLPLAQVEEELGELGPSEDHLRLAAEVAQEAGEGLARWTALDGLARVLAQQERLDEAQEVAAQAVQLGRQRGDQRLLLRALLTQGGVAARRHEKRAAVEIQREVRGLLGAVREPSLVAQARLLIGDLAQERGDLDGAELHLTAAREGFEEAGHAQGLSEALISLGGLALQRHHFEEAEKRWSKALQLKEELADRRGVAQVQGLLGQSALQREALHEAERRLKGAEALYLALGARKEAARVAVYLGSLQARMGDPGAAAATLRQAQQVLDLAQDARGVAHALTCLGLLAVEERELGQARSLFRHARQAALPEGPTPELLGAMLQLALVAAWDGELSAAARMLRELLASAGASRDQATTAKAALGVLLLLQGREREAEEALGGPTPLGGSPWPTAADRFWHGCATFVAVVLRQGERLAQLTPHSHRLNTLGAMGAPQWLAWLHGAIGGVPEDAPANLRQDALDGLEALRTLLRVPAL